ncbi:peptide transporter [Mixta theicola]|uniref:Peptide transporter n=1 Tax=Mixta theicola TaxID=1458355 RepID=A0A2K1QCS3_9GAMM|nr:ShlB/FhaC/HecB family hemolysin secretion/activation protein [Mixta theicola]PNS12796.1 peptide transporter [Mixta theicola]
MMAQAKKIVALAAALVLFNAHAAPLSPAERNQVEFEQQQRLQQNQQQREELQRSTEMRLPINVAPVEASGGCITIQHIIIEQATLPGEKQKQRLIAPYSGRCLGMPQINQLIRDVSQWYISRGYITSRAFITEQNLASGQLRITVLEGKLQAIYLDGGDSRQLSMAFPGRVGKLLNLRDIEQGMEQINRLRTTPVQIEILPGDKPGYSIVNLTATPEFPLTSTLSFDNSGQKSTGVGQLNASLTANNPLGLADKWIIGGGRSSAFSHARDAQNFQAGVSVPYGYGLFDYSYSWSDYRSTINNNGFNWLSHGDSQAHRLTGSWVVFRNGEIKTGLMAGLSQRSSHNWLNDTLLRSSSRRLTSLQLGINHTQKIAGGVATFNPLFSRGMPWFDAEHDGGKSGSLPKAEFRKWSLSASFQRPITQDLWWLTSAYGQWSPDRLYGSERLTLGGESSVRGFKEQYLSGDNGGYWRNELNYRLFTLPYIGEVSGTLALDGGWLQKDARDPWASGTLWGSAVGLGSRNRYVSTRFTLGVPLSYPGWLAPDRLSINYQVAFVF